MNKLCETTKGEKRKEIIAWFDECKMVGNGKKEIHLILGGL